MNKSHKLFIKQFIVSVVVFATVTMLVEGLFQNESNSIEYISEANKLNNLRISSNLILEQLINGNSVTYDPTNGLKIKEVITNLKESDKKKILILGSSQFVTVNDDWSDKKYLNRVDKLLQDNFSEDVLVHNLSLGGMTISEKKIVLKAVLTLYSYEAIIVSIGPYDSFKTDVRQSILDLEKTKLSRAERSDLNLDITKKKRSNFSILSLNNSVEKNLEVNIKNSNDFLKNRDAIKLWLDDVVTTGNLKTEPKEPLGWETKGQDLSTITGWVEETFVSKKKSLKIKKSTPNTNASWKGYKVLLDSPVKEIVLSSWYKSKEVDGTKLFCLDFKLDFEDGTYKWFYKDLNFKTQTDDWSFVENRFKSDKKIIAITPNILFYKGTGTLWIDNIEAKSIDSNGVISSNYLVNSNVEEAKESKEVFSIEFKPQKWDDIYKNSQDLLSYVNKIIPKTTDRYVLIPPAYHSEHKTTYSQFYELGVFKKNLMLASKKFNIKYLDASEILNEKHFVTYKTGNKKGYIEPLHFSSEGHKILADFLAKYISL